MIVGAASSSVSLSVIDKITGEGVVQFSPANTADGLRRPTPTRVSTSAPLRPDVLQGQVVANLAVQDGNKNVAMLARQDFYGEGLAESAAKNVESRRRDGRRPRCSTTPRRRTSPPRSTRSRPPSPTPSILVAFDETTKIIPQLIAKGLGPDKIKIYFVDGNLRRLLEGSFDLTGVKGTAPAPADPDPDFNKELQALDPKVKDFTYAPSPTTP